MEDLKWLAEKLPEKMNEALWEQVLHNVYEGGDLGQNIVLYSRESVVVTPPFERVMDDEAVERYKQGIRRTWGARCTCSGCGEDFYTGYTKGGILLYQRDDGANYDGAFDQSEEGVMAYGNGDGISCPICGADGFVTPRKELRQGRTYQVLQTELTVVEGYAAVMYWLISRVQDDRGGDYTVARPRDALVIDRDGRLQRFTHTRKGEVGERYLESWQWCSRVRDPAQLRYYNYDAWNKRQVGAWTDQFEYPDLTGTTGEKSAVDVYLNEGCLHPGIYLQMWKKHRQIENLVRCGFARSIDEAINKVQGYGHGVESPVIPWCDMNEVKPHRMLGMSKEGFRLAREGRWGHELLTVWRLYQHWTKDADAVEFAELVGKLTAKGVRDLLGMQQAGWNGFEVRRVARYLEKKGQLEGGVQHLIDYRKIMHEAGMAETEENLWPRDLIAAHDRMVQWKVAHAASCYQKGFTEAAEKYAALEWTDGELCIRLPRIEEELKEEGRVLRHCVGTYGRSHISGQPIFFVRKYRRPLRSYYTLNINMKGAEWNEVQLHGYGNEHHGEYKQYKHKIPKKVRDFVDRWEREVLTPWFAAQKAAELAEMEKVKKTKKKKKEAA